MTLGNFVASIAKAQVLQRFVQLVWAFYEECVLFLYARLGGLTLDVPAVSPNTTASALE